MRVAPNERGRARNAGSEDGVDRSRGVLAVRDDVGLPLDLVRSGREPARRVDLADGIVLVVQPRPGSGDVEFALAEVAGIEPRVELILVAPVEAELEVGVGERAVVAR